MFLLSCVRLGVLRSDRLVLTPRKPGLEQCCCLGGGLGLVARRGISFVLFSFDALSVSDRQAPSSARHERRWFSSPRCVWSARRAAHSTLCRVLLYRRVSPVTAVTIGKRERVGLDLDLDLGFWSLDLDQIWVNGITAVRLERKKKQTRALVFSRLRSARFLQWLPPFPWSPWIPCPGGPEAPSRFVVCSARDFLFFGAVFSAPRENTPQPLSPRPRCSSSSSFLSSFFSFPPALLTSSSKPEDSQPSCPLRKSRSRPGFSCLRHDSAPRLFVHVAATQLLISFSFCSVLVCSPTGAPAPTWSCRKISP